MLHTGYKKNVEETQCCHSGGGQYWVGVMATARAVNSVQLTQTAVKHEGLGMTSVVLHRLHMLVAGVYPEDTCNMWQQHVVFDVFHEASDAVVHNMLQLLVLLRDHDEKVFDPC
jgi:hypothetical protein